MPRGAARTLAVALLGLVALCGCATDDPGSEARPRDARADDAGGSTAPGRALPPTPVEDSPAVRPTPTAEPSGTRLPDQAARSRPARAWLSIPAIGVDRLLVVAYRGTADDRPGTRIQDRGHAATPRGPRGGVGPGEVGNFVVTAHRTTAGRPFGKLPRVRAGDHVLVEAGETVYDYRITRTMTISFRSARDRARQSAPVPGRLGEVATQPMITLSTCATPEDHAAGNFWADALGNPEHRIDKVGVLVDVRPR